MLQVENIFNLDELILLFAGLAILLGLGLMLLGLRRLGQRKFVLSGLQTLSGSSLFFAGLLLISIAINLYSYQRLTFEQPIANITFTELENQNFQAEIAFSDHDKRRFLLKGDEWQIDARIIKWQGWAQLLGLNAQYRLERISGRYSDIKQEQEDTRTVYSLVPEDRIDYWKLMHDYKGWLPWVDAYYGSATYLPMADSTSFSLSLTQAGLVARPENSEAEKIIKRW